MHWPQTQKCSEEDLAEELAFEEEIAALEAGEEEEKEEKERTVKTLEDAPAAKQAEEEQAAKTEEVARTFEAGSASAALFAAEAAPDTKGDEEAAKSQEALTKFEVSLGRAAVVLSATDAAADHQEQDVFEEGCKEELLVEDKPGEAGELRALEACTDNVAKELALADPECDSVPSAQYSMFEGEGNGAVCEQVPEEISGEEVFSDAEEKVAEPAVSIAKHTAHEVNPDADNFAYEDDFEDEVEEDLEDEGDAAAADDKQVVTTPAAAAQTSMTPAEVESEDEDDYGYDEDFEEDSS
eukprot:TRINITY_DN5093_c0_g1_i4.p1 TRINITY_DN5093_c0_g1~~TRINITY_DN5093_c0_g1_i4.p1  ORF type:complete len:297 (-),score=115.37 TRINITY_DN5093_c0_g1_i4:157-1047(-)